MTDIHNDIYLTEDTSLTTFKCGCKYSDKQERIYLCNLCADSIRSAIISYQGY